MKKFYYKGNVVAVLNLKFSEQNHEKGRSCWCCGGEFKHNEECVALINNYRDIPNMLLHKECFEQYDTDEARCELCDKIAKDYSEYTRLNKIFM